MCHQGTCPAELPDPTLMITYPSFPRSARPRRKALLAALVGLASACAAEGEPAGPLLAPRGEPPIAQSRVSVQMEPILANVQALVFEPACATGGCHDAEHQAGMLDLSSAQASYDSLVGADGQGVPVANRVAAENRWLRVKPGDPERSFIYRKMELPGVGEGAPMPVGDLQITAPYMHLLHLWIEAGAR